MTPGTRRLSAAHRAFVALVFLTGSLALGHALLTLVSEPSTDWSWTVLAVLTIASGFFAVKVPTVNATLSISEVFLFSLVLLYGGAPAVVTVAVDGLIVSLVRRHRQSRHAAFNMAEPALSMWVAAAAYEAVRRSPLGGGQGDLLQVGIPAMVLAMVYFLMNSGLNAVAVATESGRRASDLIRKYFVWVSLNYFACASIATVVAVNYGGSLFGALLLIAPLIVLSYFTFRSSMGRLEDENTHLGEVNRLYLKVVETLAMAVDAKDQVTHGHVRRVQAFSLTLAQRLGVTEPQQVKAIEAASLLHDIGKLAVPEHILNKPGKLSEAEYDRMKMHAPLGADLLSAVAFPYPVVPIVRHHHENWDGTGYPDGLAGTAIPIGARILAVVDCYDALRSHRPYRRALSPDEAMAIVRERRGTMYDPDIVDAFEDIQDAIEAEEVPDPLPDVMERVASAARDMRLVEPDSTTLSLELRLHATNTLLRLYEDLERLPQDAPVDDLCDAVSRHVRRLAPASLVVFYVREDSSDDLRVLCASGFGEALTDGLTIPVGQGVSGWVTAQRRAVINADAALDLGEASTHLSPRHRSVLAVPLISAGRAIGAVTLYSIQAGAFSDEQRLALELLTPSVADLIARHAAVRPPAGPPHAHHAHEQALAVLLRHESLCHLWPGRPLGVLCLTADGDDDVMAHAAVAITQATRVADLVFRPSDRELVVVMPDCDAGAGQLIVDRIQAALAAGGEAVRRGTATAISLGFACSPHDGDQLWALLSVARRRIDTERQHGASERARTAVLPQTEGAPWPA